MPTITLHLESPIQPTFRALQIAGMLDVPLDQRLQHHLTADIPALDEPWTIGAIVGPSGSGKTTLAKVAFGDALYEPQPWPGEKAIIDCLDDGRPEARPTIKQLTRLLTAVGLGSVPTWLKPYQLLSTGEQFRADLARAILNADKKLTQRHGGTESRDGNSLRAPVPLCENSLLVIDEFTSSLDRTIAKTTSAALARFIRNEKVPLGQRDLRFVAVTCHDDILPWLQPDWVLQLDTSGNAQLTRGRLHQPTIRLPVRQVPQALWSHLARHHYLIGNLARSATCYAAFSPSWGGPLAGPEKPIAFCAAVAALGWKKTKRITRLVTLPEFQGLGIASRLLEFVAQHEASKGNRVTITASHPAILAHCQNSPHWQFTGHKPTGSTVQTYRGRPIGCSTGRAVASFEFTAPNHSPEAHQRLTKYSLRTHLSAQLSADERERISQTSAVVQLSSHPSTNKFQK